MNPLSVVLVLAVATISSASLIALSPASGSVGVDATGAVLAGPSGSIRTDNGLAGLGAGAQLSGPAGDVRTRGGAAALSGPGAIGGIATIGAAPLGLGLGLTTGLAGPIGIAGPLGIAAGPIGLGRTIIAPASAGAIIRGGLW